MSAPSPGAEAPGVTHMGLLAEPIGVVAKLDMDAPLPWSVAIGKLRWGVAIGCCNGVSPLPWGVTTTKLRWGVAIVCCNGVSPLPWDVSTTNPAGALPSSVATASRRCPGALPRQITLGRCHRLLRRRGRRRYTRAVPLQITLGAVPSSVATASRRCPGTLPPQIPQGRSHRLLQRRGRRRYTRALPQEGPQRGPI